MFKLTHAGMSHVGMKRNHNEDTILVAESCALYLVADGMGGYAAGEVASKIAVDTISEFYIKNSSDEDLTWPYRPAGGLDEDQAQMAVAIKLANLVICETALTSKKLQGMGSTIVAAQFKGNSIHIGHVGDSRAYRLRGETFEQLTEDHSLLNEFKKKGELTEADARNFPYKNILLRGLGKELNVGVDVQSQPVESGDVYLLCSDGLTGELTDEALAQILLSNGLDLSAACQEMIERSCESGGKDNISCLLVRAESN